VDLLAVSEHAGNKRQMAIEIRRGHVIGSVLRPALREGKVLYERR
jgi:hypothetical protein